MNSLVVGLALLLVAILRTGSLIGRRWRRRGVRRRRSLRRVRRRRCRVRRRLRKSVRRRRGVHGRATGEHRRSTSIWDWWRRRGQKSGRHGRDGHDGGDHEDQHAASGQVLLTTNGRGKWQLRETRHLLYPDQEVSTATRFFWRRNFRCSNLLLPGKTWESWENEYRAFLVEFSPEMRQKVASVVISTEKV